MPCAQGSRARGGGVRSRRVVGVAAARRFLGFRYSRASLGASGGLGASGSFWEDLESILAAWEWSWLLPELQLKPIARPVAAHAPKSGRASFSLPLWQC